MRQKIISPSILRLNGCQCLLKGLVDLQSVDVDCSGGVEEGMLVFQLHSSLLLGVVSQSAVDVPQIIHQGTHDALQTLHVYQVLVGQSVQFILILGCLLVSSLLGFLQLVTSPFQFLCESLSFLSKSIGLSFLLSLDADAVFFDISLKIFEVYALLLQLLFQFSILFFQFGIIGPEFTIAVLQITHGLSHPTLLIGLSAIFFLCAMGLLQYFLQHLLFFPKDSDDIFLFFQIVLHVVVLPLLLLGLFGLFATSGELHDATFVLLYDFLLFLHLIFVISLQLYLIPLQSQDLCCPFVQFPLCPVFFSLGLYQLLIEQVEFLLKSLVFGREREEFGLSLERILPLLLGITDQDLQGVSSAISLLGVEEVIKGSDFFLQFDILLTGVLFEFDFFLQDCLLVAEVAHRIDEAFESQLQLLDTAFLLLAEGLDDFGPILFIDLSFEELVLLFVEFDVIIQFLILAAHLLSDIVEEIAQLFSCLVETGTGLIGILILKRLQLSDAALQKLDLLYAAELALSFQITHTCLDGFEETDGTKDRPFLALFTKLQFEQSAQTILLFTQEVVKLTQFTQLGEGVFLMRGLRVCLVGLLYFSSLIANADYSAGGTFLPHMAILSKPLLGRPVLIGLACGFGPFGISFMLPIPDLFRLLEFLAAVLGDHCLQLRYLCGHLLILLVDFVEL